MEINGNTVTLDESDRVLLASDEASISVEDLSRLLTCRLNLIVCKRLQTQQYINSNLDSTVDHEEALRIGEEQRTLMVDERTLQSYLGKFGVNN